MITTGPRWVQAMYGGRQRFQRLPANLVVRVTAPGRVAVCKGLVTLATLVGGRIVQPTLDVFDSTWLPATFAGWRDELRAQHREARERASTPWTELDPDVTRLIVQHSVRSVIGLMRNSHHGGTILFLPTEGDGSIGKLGGRVRPKYGFASEEPRRRFPTLIIALINALAAAQPTHPEGRKVGWEEYVSSTDGDVAQIDEAIFELAHQVTGLAAVDGAVVLDKRFELLGFGAEIGGDLPAVRWVARALDAEGTAKMRESVERDGTRHRSAYRCATSCTTRSRSSCRRTGPSASSSGTRARSRTGITCRRACSTCDRRTEDLAGRVTRALGRGGPRPPDRSRS